MAKTLDTNVSYDVNTVTLDQLTTIPRIGRDLALLLLERRKEVGGFKSIEQIRNLKIKGMGGKKIESLIQYLRFSDGPKNVVKTEDVSAPIAETPEPEKAETSADELEDLLASC